MEAGLLRKEKAAAFIEATAELMDKAARSVVSAREIMTDVQLKSYKRTIGTFISELGLDHMEIVFKEYPDLKPAGWDDPYVPSSQKDLDK